MTDLTSNVSWCPGQFSRDESCPQSHCPTSIFPLWWIKTYILTFQTNEHSAVVIIVFLTPLKCQQSIIREHKSQLGTQDNEEKPCSIFARSRAQGQGPLASWWVSSAASDSASISGILDRNSKNVIFSHETNYARILGNVNWRDSSCVHCANPWYARTL